MQTINFDKLKVKSRDLVLDIGCGEGRHSLGLHVDREINAVGMDLSLKDMRTAKSRIKDFSISKNNKSSCVFGAGSIHSLPFNDNLFDAVICSEVLEHLDSLESAVSEIVRVLKPGGSLIAIETFGHNLLFNCKRKWNVFRGNRTTWAADHIMKNDEWRKMSAHFETVNIYYFGLTGLILVPLIRFLPHKIKIISTNFFSTIDKQLFKIEMLKPLAFKTVVQLTGLRQS